MITRRTFTTGLAGAGALAGLGGFGALAQTGGAQLVGTWRATEPDGRERLAYFGADGLVFFAVEQTFLGGRWALEGDTLVVRRNWRLGYHAFLDTPTRHAVTDFRPGERFTLEEGSNEESRPIVHSYVGPDHPVAGALWAALVGRYLVVAADGRREIWDFQSNGWVMIDRPTEYFAAHWRLEGETLFVKRLLNESRLSIRNFQRGRGFMVGPEDNPDVLLYMDGPYFAPPMDAPSPTQAQQNQALAEHAAISRKANATNAALNNSTRMMSDMMEMMADDIAGRTYRYEWIPRY